MNCRIVHPSTHFEERYQIFATTMSDVSTLVGTGFSGPIVPPASTNNNDIIDASFGISGETGSNVVPPVYDSSDDDEEVPVARTTATIFIATKLKVVDGGTGTGGKRGLVCTAIEELMACKVFIAGSEDAQVGKSQKGKVFKKKMHKFYNLFLIEQEKRDAQRLAIVGRTHALVPAVSCV